MIQNSTHQWVSVSATRTLAETQLELIECQAWVTHEWIMVSNCQPDLVTGFARPSFETVESAHSNQ
jgi:hypothetical protein